MKTIQIYEVGDQVEVTSHKEYGLCTNNKQGGTENMPIETPVKCKIIKTWGDYEIGRRYIGLTEKKKTIYFGEFDVTILGLDT